MTADAPSEELPPLRASDELRRVVLPRALRGYDRDAVDQLVARVVEILDGLEDQARQLESELADGREQSGRELEKLATAQRELEVRMQRSAEERDQLARVVAGVTHERGEIAETIEEIKAEREERITYTERLERELTGHRELESSLKHMVVAAERIGSDLRALTEREATALLEEARAEARRLLAAASGERELLIADVRRIRAMLQAAQASLDDRALFAQWAPDAKDTPDEAGASGSRRF